MVKINWLETIGCYYFPSFSTDNLQLLQSFFFSICRCSLFQRMQLDLLLSEGKNEWKGKRRTNRFSILISFVPFPVLFLFLSCKMHHVIIISPSGAENYFDGIFFSLVWRKILSCRCQSIYEEYPDYIFKIYL